MDGLTPPEHGGDLAQAIARYRIPAAGWLDLSAAINPEPYAVPPLPAAVFQHLPSNDDAVTAAAVDYYGVPASDAARSIVAAAGSQALIQWLPLLRRHCRVAIPAIGYREHAFRWRCAGHEVIEYDAGVAHAVDEVLRQNIDVLVVINPNNPLTTVYEPARLLGWLQTLQRRGGWLVVDEAFMDATPAHSLADKVGAPGLIVLRSLGKFFGLAGVRCGFALCESSLAATLRAAVGPWPLSGPTAFVAEQALRDRAWQQRARQRLAMHSRACAEAVVAALGGKGAVSRADLFVSAALPAEEARAVQEALARCGIWVRLIELDLQRALLRFGVLAPGDAWLRLQAALERVPA